MKGKLLFFSIFLSACAPHALAVSIMENSTSDKPAQENVQEKKKSRLTLGA